jgi:hypothetical protein
MMNSSRSSRVELRQWLSAGKHMPQKNQSSTFRRRERLEGMVIYNASMEQRVKIQGTREEAEAMVKRHQSPSHPEIQCQCLECLYAKEVIAQCKIWKGVP